MWVGGGGPCFFSTTDPKCLCPHLALVVSISLPFCILDHLILPIIYNVHEMERQYIAINKG